MNQPESEAIETRRRAIYTRVKTRLAASGTPIDDHPDFIALVERWISGNIEMLDVAKGYGDVRRSARASKAIDTSMRDIADTATSPLDLLREIQGVIGFHDLSLDRE